MKELLIYISQYGFDGLYLMVYTLLIWLIFLLILVANPRNRLNQWCFFTGLFLSIGTLKEFLYYDLGALLSNPVIHAIPDWLYSVLSGCFYFFSMPCGFMFALYFSHPDLNSSEHVHFKHIFCFIPPVLAFFIFPFPQTLRLQNTTVFCLSVALYNWVYGIVLTVIMLKAIRKERFRANHRQRVLAMASILIPLWCWLILAFPYHALGLSGFSKAWQLNMLIVAAILSFILYHAFHDGIWGLRFRREHYDWHSGEKKLPQNAHYVGHSLKNDLAKITWCTDLLSQKNTSSKELEILKQSVDHLERFTAHTQIYSDKIVLKPQNCSVAEIFESLAEGIILPENKHLQISSCDSVPLFCDPIHLEETLRNLINNAAESIQNDGIIQLSYYCQKQKRKAVISVSDNGCGIEKKNLKRLFEPFYTTRNGSNNMGLGLYYCWNVMNAHSGRLQVRSVPGKGSTFSLYFPL